jgi:hypothetical protein
MRSVQTMGCDVASRGCALFGTAAGKPARLQSYPPAPEGTSCFGCLWPAQYLRIRLETSWRSEEFMDLRPRRLASVAKRQLREAER